jgi:hypothetical protein
MWLAEGLRGGQTLDGRPDQTGVEGIHGVPPHSLHGGKASKAGKLAFRRYRYQRAVQGTIASGVAGGRNVR